MDISDLPDPVIPAIVDALVAGDYEFVAKGTEIAADLFRRAVEQYAHRLSHMDAAAWDRAAVYRSDHEGVTKYITDVTLPDEDGYCDLTLTIETLVSPSGARTSRAVDVHVL